MLKVAAVAAVAFGVVATGGALAGVMAGTGAAAGATSAMAGLGGALASGAGAVAGGVKAAGAGLMAADPLVKAGLIQVGGQMLQGGMQPTPEEQAQAQKDVIMSNYQGTSGIFNQGSPERLIQPQARAIEPQAIQTSAAPQQAQPGLVARYDPEQRRFVS